MAVPYKPHTLSLASASVTDDARNVAKTPDYSDAIQPVTCHAQELTAETAFERYGVETKKPVLVLAELSSAGSFGIGWEVTNISRAGSVWRAGPLYVRYVERHQDGLPLDHVAVLLDEKGS